MHHNFMQIEGVANLHLLPPTGALLSIGFAKVRGHPRRGGSILGQVTVFRTDIFTHSLTHRLFQAPTGHLLCEGLSL